MSSLDYLEIDLKTVARAIREACQDEGYLVSINERHWVWFKMASAAIEAVARGKARLP